MKGGTTYRILSDQVGSVRLVVNATTGAVAQRIDYDAFGVVTQDTNPGFQPFGFAGGLTDLDTGLVRFGARDYDPRVGRWTSKDEIRFEGQSTNLYEYSLGDPGNMIDINGNGPFGAAAAFAVGGACALGLAAQDTSSQVSARNAVRDAARLGRDATTLSQAIGAVQARLRDPCLTPEERSNLLANLAQLEDWRDQLLSDLDEPVRDLAKDSLRGVLTQAGLAACSAAGFAVGLALLGP